MFRKVLLIALICFGCSFLASAQNILKTAEDTSFVMDRVFFPKLQLNLAIYFSTSDFSTQPHRNYRLSDIDSLQKLIRKDPSNGDFYRQLSRVYSEFDMVSQGQKVQDTAKDLFMNQMVKNPADTHAIRNLAEIYLAEVKLDLAEAYYKELLKLVPENSSAWNGLAMISLTSGNFDEAIHQMEEAIHYDESRFDNYCQMTNILMMKSFSDLNQIDSAGFDTLSFRNILHVSFIEEAAKRNPNDLSLQALKNALSITGLLYESFIQSSDFYAGHTDTMKFNPSDESRKEILRLKSVMLKYANGEFKTKVFPYNCLILAYLLENNADSARYYFEQGVKYNPRSQNFYDNIIGVCALLGKKDDAFAYLLTIDSIRPLAKNFLMTAYFYFLDSNYEASLYWAQKALADEPQNFYVFMGMAAIYTRMLDFTKAALYLDKAAGMYSEHPDVYLLTGILYLFDLSPMRAKSTFEQLQNSPAAMPEVDELLERFWP